MFTCKSIDYSQDRQIALNPPGMGNPSEIDKLPRAKLETRESKSDICSAFNNVFSEHISKLLGRMGVSEDLLRLFLVSTDH